VLPAESWGKIIKTKGIIKLAGELGNLAGELQIQPAVRGRPIPLSLGKELGYGTRRRIGQRGYSVEMDRDN
jgi:hypothetical protein